jgi:protein TonB
VIGGLPGPSGGPNRDGVVGSVMEKVSQFVPPPPPSTVVQQPRPTPAVPIRVTSGVLAANLIHKVVPTYPPLARQARIFGTVRLQGVIAKDGRIRDLQLLSGHPLLAPAALDAVRQWVYRPTLLNGDPVEVTAPIDVIFTLGN